MPNLEKPKKNPQFLIQFLFFKVTEDAVQLLYREKQQLKKTIKAQNYHNIHPSDESV